MIEITNHLLRQFNEEYELTDFVDLTTIVRMSHYPYIYGVQCDLSTASLTFSVADAKEEIDKIIEYFKQNKRHTS